MKTFFSEPITMRPGMIKVTVTLPKFQNKCFNGISRDARLAKWAAAKTAVIQLKKQSNSFIRIKQKDLYEHYKSMQ